MKLVQSKCRTIYANQLKDTLRIATKDIEHNIDRIIRQMRYQSSYKLK